LDEQQDYQQAYETLRTGGTVQSIGLFKQFLLDFPRGEYADNASYWLAEAYKLNQQSNLAKLTFQNLITYFPNSPKVSDAKLKLGFIEAELNNLDRARELLTDITRSYPGSNAANLASKKLAEINRY
jgi:tol-pal system protein YbgF